MPLSIHSIRPFIGAKDFDLSSAFYRDLGFKEIILSPVLTLFEKDQIGFYLQKAFVKDWVDNTMIFAAVPDLQNFWEYLSNLNLPAKYQTVKIKPIVEYDWGKECFVHDPSGILWHFGEFNNK